MAPKVITAENRLDRIEDKIDKLAETVVSLARVEEKLIGLEKSNQFIIEQAGKYDVQIDEIDVRTTKLETTLSGITKLFWYIIASIIAAAAAAWFAVTDHIMPHK